MYIKKKCIATNKCIITLRCTQMCGHYSMYPLEKATDSVHTEVKSEPIYSDRYSFLIPVWTVQTSTSTCVKNTCLCDRFIRGYWRECYGTFTWGGGRTVASSGGMQQAGSRGNYWPSTSISRQDSFLFAIVCVRACLLCVLPGRSLCEVVFTHLPVLPVQLKASGCLPNTDRRPLKQPPVTGRPPSSCHCLQNPPIPNAHLSTSECVESKVQVNGTSRD